jgi:alanine-glyoxylate transaminase/serine-glyoxylate transaminase/serine-pyruvate transaminase
MIEEEGLERVWARHDRLARAVWAACDAWGAGGPLRLAVARPERRSRAVTAVVLEDADRLRAWVEASTGVTLGIGLASASGTFRVGHMGHVNAHMVLGALGAIEAGLGALGIPHGAGGVAAAARAVGAA